MTRNTLALIACCLISPAAAVAQTGGLTKVQLYALQQQLKEECGLEHSTGVMDGPTRHAIAVCNKKYGTQGNGAALLAAMNIGFSTGDNPPEGMGSVMGNNATSTEEAKESSTAEHKEREAAMKSKTTKTSKTVKTVKTVKTDTTKMKAKTTPAKKY